MVLVTNPKVRRAAKRRLQHGRPGSLPRRDPASLSMQDARYASPFEAQDMAYRSTHVRILAFSPDPIASITVSIDGAPAVEAQRATRRPQRDSEAVAPLWVVPWNPRSLSPGLHTIRVLTRDTVGRTSAVEHDFSVDGTAAPFASAFAVWVMTGNLKSHVDGIGVFVALWTLGVVLLGTPVFMRFAIERGTAGTPPSARGAMVDAWLATQLGQRWLAKPRRSGDTSRGSSPTPSGGRLGSWAAHVYAPYVALAHLHPRVFFGLGAMHIYLYVGPWFAGRIYDNDWAAAFFWGIVTVKCVLAWGQSAVSLQAVRLTHFRVLFVSRHL